MHTPTGDRSQDKIRVSPRITRHIENRTLVLPEFKLLYLPVPKAGWTSMLWLMAGLAGIPSETFRRAESPVTPLAMTVHSKQVWRESRRRLVDLSPEQRARVLSEDGWLRFTVVRDPASRLWASWQSKLLLREPAFLRRFGSRPWYPTVPECPDDVICGFRRFVTALDAEWDDESFIDKHWCVQHDLVSRLPLNHIGRIEHIEETTAALQAHLARASIDWDLPQANQTPLPYDPAVCDESTVEIVRRRYADDFVNFGYPRLECPRNPRAYVRWTEQAEPQIPVVRALTGAHERLAAWDDVARERRRELRTTRAGLQRAQRQRKALGRQLKATNRAHRQRAAALKARVRSLEAQRDALRSRLDRMRASRSWRLTRPLRAASGFISRRPRPRNASR
ncbi:MAG: sulfotransferase family 2 domain-containing protein [Nocardioidaceae bacterium]